MAVCQICGCKTEELDFVDVHIGELDKRACSFCARQLKNLGSETVSDAQLKWLKAAVQKEVPEREGDVLDALNAMLEKFGGEAEISAPSGTVSEVKYYPAQSSKRISESDVDKEIARLTARVDKLEKTIIAMKRSQLIRLVCEVAIPVILGIAILIVFFSSGLYDRLAGLMTWMV